MLKKGKERRFIFKIGIFLTVFFIFFIIVTPFSYGVDLPEIKKRGILRHLGVPYANFVTGSGDGLDVDLMKLFAKEIGVKYVYVKTTWKNIIPDLIGKLIKPKGDNVEILNGVSIKGDIIATGFTILPWREKVVDFSVPTFPTQVWLIARADSPIQPIKGSNNPEADIKEVKYRLKGVSVIGKANTCLDPKLYGLKEAGARIILFKRALNEIVPAVINKEAEAAILDVPDVLVALDKWGEDIKVIGPISKPQKMGCAFPKSSPLLKKAFNEFFERCKKNGTYYRLVKKYYPMVFLYFPDFFK